ncbi:MAG: oligosaccharide flippase family protein [Bacteroidota bacterium]|nr:oligosaccharide flippase family protein [Bacteroidota bacterium]MDP4234790.1 oligosaccharide flippase family protein [Bacteroidota bacterium]MDP4244102.1 oligosaccharide flippase family protein [Bacteroidota bacterium]MDP4289434.1 oligosaccharide flippase family protein [Bacteroidota bacterium]
MRFSEHLGKGAWAFASRALPLVYAIALIMVARAIPREEYGTLQVFQALFGMLFTFSDGFALQAIVKFGVEPNVNLEELVTTTVALFVAFLSVSLTILLIFSSFVASILNIAALTQLLPWLALFAIFTMPRVVFAKVLQTNFRMKEIFFVDFANFGMAAIVLVVLLTSGHVHSATDVIRVTIATGLLSSVVATILVRPFLKFRPKYSRSMLSRISNFVRYQAAMGVASTAQQNFDTLVVSGFAGATGAAVYGVAKMLFRGFDVVRETMTLFVFPAASKYYSRKDIPTLRAILEKSVSLLYLVMIPAGILLEIVAPTLFHLLYGTKYDASVPIFRLLLMAITIFPIQMVFGVAMSGMGKIKELFRMFVLSLIVNVILATILLATIGITGAAIAFVVASAVQAVQFLIYIRKEVQVVPSQLLNRGLFDIFGYLLDLK